MAGKLSRWEQIQEYARARLKAEVETQKRGYQAKLCLEMSVSSAHMSNVLSAHGARGIGEDFAHKLAQHWGITFAELERLAVGGDAEPVATAVLTAQPALVGVPAEDFRRMLREELAALLDERDAKRGSGEHAIETKPVKKRATPRKG